MLMSEYDAFFWPKHEALDVRINNDSLEDCLLHFAVLIEKKQSKMERKWEILSKYWVENLAYVATLCQRNHHAQLLRKGGEFFTHAWLLIEHLNLKESFQKSQTRPH